MKIHELPSIKKRRQRIGRSGKRGSYSGRGVKGQKSRAGRRLRPAERDILLRIPKKRGFKNKPNDIESVVYNVGQLARQLKSYATGKAPIELDLTMLKSAGLVGKNFRGKIKLLGAGEIDFALNVGTGAMRVSKLAADKISKAGGNPAGSKSGKSGK